LDIWPKHKVQFPSNIRGQLYIPAINWFLMLGCIGMVLYFRKSTKMEAAFGLSVTLTMLMSSVLIAFYLRIKRVPVIFIVLITALFLCVELGFLLANLQKIAEGGWMTLLIGSVLFTVMLVWNYGKKLKSSFVKLLDINAFIPELKKLSEDTSIQKYATNLVYLTSSDNEQKIEKIIIDYILNNGLPKRADIFWFVHVNIIDEPYFKSYKAHTLVKNDMYYIAFNFGFREQPRIGYYFKQVVNQMIENKEVDIATHHKNEYQQMAMGDFKFVTMDSFLSYDNQMSFWKNFIMKFYYNLRIFSVKEAENFELDRSNLSVERYPLIVSSYVDNTLTREE
jgi:KUP system potassium uptake protein